MPEWNALVCFVEAGGEVGGVGLEVGERGRGRWGRRGRGGGVGLGSMCPLACTCEFEERSFGCTCRCVGGCT